MTKNKNNKTLYMGLINLGGIQGPFKLKYDAEFDHGENPECYWDPQGDVSSPGPGYIEKEGYISFSSFNKNEVKLFLKGAKALKSVLTKSILH